MQVVEAPVQFSSAAPEPTLTVDPFTEATEVLVPEAVPEAEAEAETETFETSAGEKVGPVIETVITPEIAPVPSTEFPSTFKEELPAALLRPVEDADFPSVSFMRETSVESAWRRPLVRVVLGLTSLSLLLAFCLQVGIQERDRIVAVHPEARPVLLALCAPLRCALGPLRQIESIVIENSSFAKIRGDAYRLGLSIRNAAPVEVAMPTLELTLTDSQDQTVLRRVFLPVEFGAPTNALAAGSEWSGGLAVNAIDVEGVERITGYRILAFYP